MMRGVVVCVDGGAEPWRNDFLPLVLSIARSSSKGGKCKAEWTKPMIQLLTELAGDSYPKTYPRLKTKITSKHMSFWSCTYYQSIWIVMRISTVMAVRNCVRGNGCRAYCVEKSRIEIFQLI